MSLLLEGMIDITEYHLQELALINLVSSQLLLNYGIDPNSVVYLDSLESLLISLTITNQLAISH